MRAAEIDHSATGLVGIIINMLIISTSVLSIRRGLRNKNSKRFFFAMLSSGVLELPRFFDMFITRAYATTKTTAISYDLHIASSLLFFVSLSIVCHQWICLLQLGSHFQLIYGSRLLLVTNVAFGSIDVASLVYCSLSSSLLSYLSSLFYEVSVIIEVLRIATYTGFLCFFGSKVALKFWRYSQVEQLESRKETLNFLQRHVGDEGMSPSRGIGGRHSAKAVSEAAIFNRVLFRLTTVLSICTICFALRIAMLLIEILSIHGTPVDSHYRFAILSTNVTDTIARQGDDGLPYHVRQEDIPSHLYYHGRRLVPFPLYGLLWFTLSEFIPRAIPALALIVLMRARSAGGAYV
jgi:hypothetical protein